MDGVWKWLKDNLGIILGVCTGVAVIEVSHSLIRDHTLYSYACSFKGKPIVFFLVVDTWFNADKTAVFNNRHLT